MICTAIICATIICAKPHICLVWRVCITVRRIGKITNAGVRSLQNHTSRNHTSRTHMSRNHMSRNHTSQDCASQERGARRTSSSITAITRAQAAESRLRMLAATRLARRTASAMLRLASIVGFGCEIAASCFSSSASSQINPSQTQIWSTKGADGLPRAPFSSAEI